MSKEAAAGGQREKGPIIWGDLDQKALDDAYDQSVYAPNQKLVQHRRDINSRRARVSLGEPVRYKYGSSEIEGLDVYRTSVPRAPIAVFIHGGAWRNGASWQFATPAEMFVGAGVHYVVLDFTNVDAAGGDLMPMAEQVRRAVAWVYRNAKEIGGDPEQLYLIGHSSGAHLTGCACITDWARSHDLPSRVVAGAVLCSGMYDLRPVRLSKRSAYVKFTDQMVSELSAIDHIDRITMPLVVAHGTEETPEFQRQSQALARAVEAAGKPVELIVAEGYNHFEIIETLANPYGLLGRAALRLMGLGPL
jgi:arylformamidase